jgi:putative transposase
MPSRNVYKNDVADSFYHVYFRGGNKSRIFRDPTDFMKFLSLFDRYLSLGDTRNSAGVSFPNYHNKVELVSYCLMPNHVHMLLYQVQQGAMAAFMRSLLVSYTMYFNKRYSRTGPLLESRYKASLIADDAYLDHISRYIHLNPRNWREYEYSSLPYYLQQVSDSWIEPERIISMFTSSHEYLKFVEDYQQNKKMLDILKKELANANEL